MKFTKAAGVCSLGCILLRVWEQVDLKKRAEGVKVTQEYCG